MKALTINVQVRIQVDGPLCSEQCDWLTKYRACGLFKADDGRPRKLERQKGNVAHWSSIRRMRCIPCLYAVNVDETPRGATGSPEEAWSQFLAYASKKGLEGEELEALLERVGSKLSTFKPVDGGDLIAALTEAGGVAGPVLCEKCGKPVEANRECYVTPICYACLPPPPPLQTIELKTPVGEPIQTWEDEASRVNAERWAELEGQPVECTSCGRRIENLETVFSRPCVGGFHCSDCAELIGRAEQG